MIAAWEGNIDKAQTLFDQGNASAVNQGILDIRQGDYKGAVSKLKGNGYNATLAKNMNGNNVTTKRATTGIPASKWDWVIGKKAKKNFLYDENIKI